MLWTPICGPILSFPDKQEPLSRSKCQGLSQGQAVDNHWLNYSVLGLSFRVGLGFGIFFSLVFRFKWLKEGPSSRPLYNLLLFQFKQRAQSPSSGGPRGPGRAAPPSAAGRLCLLRLHTPGWPPAGAAGPAGHREPRPGTGSPALPALGGPGRVGAPGRVSKARASDRDTPPR